ncbi:MAG: carboxypeptidase regulatory-like domain-containing protein [Bdellovibrionales bacterium]|nr:carboxypeptidase regulatory-like domain-containing protein [Bdellovibrionales bacterium]
MSTVKANNALLNRIAKVTLKEFGRSDLYVAQPPAGMHLSDAHLDLFQQLELDRLKDPATVARLVEISRIIDCIQDGSSSIATPDQDPGYLSDIFPQLINNVEFSSTPLSADEQHQYEQALAILYEEYPLLKTTMYQEFCLLRTDLEKKDIVLVEMRQTLQQELDPEETTLLENELAVVERLCSEQQDLLDALDRTHSFRAAESIIDGATRKVAQIPESVRVMLDTIELLYIKDPITNDMHIGCSFFPAHLSPDNWVPLRLTGEDIAQRTSSTSSVTEGTDELDDSDIELIELEVQTVTCERPWLWSALFENGHWSWRTPSAPISTGKADDNAEALIPAYIHGLIFVRNLTIKGQPSAQRHFERIKQNDISNLLLRSNRLVHLGVGAQIPDLYQPIIVDLKRAQPIINVRINAEDNSIMRRVTPVSHSAIRPTLTATQTPSLSDNGFAVIRNPNLNNLIWSRQRNLVLQALALNMTTHGQVVDEEGNSIYQANVTVEYKGSRRQTVTDRNGKFTFVLNQGRYPISVEKAGFTAARGSLTVPQPTAPQLIRMQQTNPCPLKICLIERVDNIEQPFSGQAKIVIRGENYERIEVMDGQPTRRLLLPAGTFTVAVVSSTATEVSPQTQQINLHSGGTTGSTLTYRLVRAPLLSNPNIQLLGFICRKVPACP